MNVIAVYEYDRKTAEQNHEVNMWLFSGVENEYCRNSIEKFLQIKEKEKQEESLCKMMKNYGIDRIKWVLAFSIHAHAEHFNEQAQAWAETVVPENYPMEEAKYWILSDHFPEIAVLASGIARQTAKFGMLDASACSEKMNQQNPAGKLLILRSGILGDSCKVKEAQYFYCSGYNDENGFIRGYFLVNGQKEAFRKMDFLGIADEKKLPEWVERRLAEIRSPKMKIRIFQIDHEKDKNFLEFAGYEQTMQSGGINPAIYSQIYGGTVNASSVEEVFRICRDSPPSGYCGQKPHVSDVIEICDGEMKGFYFCDSSGFKPIDFDISQTNHNEMLRVLILECNKEPYIAEIQDCLKAKQSAVGGLIEPVFFDETNKALIYCDEEFLLKDYAPNRSIGELVIHGTFMIVGNGENEEGEGIEISLTDEQIQKFTEQFRYPLIYMRNQEHSQSQEENESFSFYSV